MTVTASSSDFAGPYAPDGVATSFPFAFKAMSEDEVKAIRLASNGAETILSGYTVTLNATGGTLVFSSALLPGDPLYIVSDPSFDQQLRFDDQGAWSPSSLDEGLDRSVIRDIALASAISRAPLAPPTEQMANLPIASARAGQYFAFDAEGDPYMSAGTGNDSALRTDLASSTGGLLVGLSDGRSVESALFTRPRPLAYGTRSRDETLNQARLTANSVHTLAAGYAKTAGGGSAITGGFGKQLFLVDTDSMDATLGSYSSETVNGLPVGRGSYAWCLAQAAPAGGMIVFDTRGHFDLIIRDNVQHRFDIGMNDITVAIPGRNVIFWHASLTGSTVIKGHNLIFLNPDFRTLPGALSGDYDGSGNKVEAGLVSVFPQNIDKLMFVNPTFDSPSDGALDIASTTFTTASSPAYVSILNPLFRNADEVSLFGAISDTTTASDTRKLFVTLYNPTYDGCGQRQPKALGLAMVDVISPHIQTQPWRRDQPSPTAEYGACSGVEVQNGGWAFVRGGLFTSLDGLSHEATKLVANPTSGETGRIRHVGNAAENGMTFATDSNSTLVPDPPYIADLPTVSVPAAGAARTAWEAAHWLAVGAAVDAAPTGEFAWNPTSTAYPNQKTTVRRRVNGAFVSGREIRVDPQTEVPLDPGPPAGDTLDIIPRGYTRTAGFTEGKTTKTAIGGTILDLANADSSYFLVQGNGAAATVKHLIRSDGVVIDDGTVLHLFGSSSAPVTLVNATSATVTATAATDLINDTGHGETVSGFQVVMSNSGGALPAPLVANTIYYGIYVGSGTYKLATTFANAIAGTAIDLTDAGTGTHTSTLGSFNLANSADIILNSSAKGQQFRLNNSNWRFTTFGAGHPLTASKVFDWASLLTATQQSTTVTATGAEIGDAALATMSIALSGTRLWAEVTAADTVTVYQRNDTGGTVDLASGTLRVVVTKLL